MLLTTSLPSAAAAPRRIGPKVGSRSSSVAKVCTNVGERKRSFDGTGGGGACVIPLLSGSSEPARATKILVNGGIQYRPPA